MEARRRKVSCVHICLGQNLQPLFVTDKKKQDMHKISNLSYFWNELTNNSTGFCFINCCQFLTGNLYLNTCVSIHKYDA